MDKFLDTYNQPKLNQEDINHLNGPFIHNEFEEVKVSLRKRAQDLMYSWLNFTNH
jgi:hypothetical protein